MPQAAGAQPADSRAEQAAMDQVATVSPSHRGNGLDRDAASNYTGTFHGRDTSLRPDL
jgi:hypothetical protein